MNIIVKGGKRSSANQCRFDPKRKDRAMQSQRPDLRVRNMPESSCNYWNKQIHESDIKYV